MRKPISIGFLYSTSAFVGNLVITNPNPPKVISTFTSDTTMTATIEGSTSGRVYYYRAYISSPAGTGYGPVCSFTTRTIVVPTFVTKPDTKNCCRVRSAKCYDNR